MTTLRPLHMQAAESNNPCSECFVYKVVCFREAALFDHEWCLLFSFTLNTFYARNDFKLE